jgi:membrane fusion protein (multidrug efflux system)
MDLKHKLTTHLKPVTDKIQKISFKRSPKNIAIALALLLSIILILWLLLTKFSESTDDAYLKSDIIQISAKVSGYVKEMNFIENQAIKTGEILVKIDDQDFLPKSLESAADLVINQINLKKILQHFSIQQLQTSKSQAAITASKAELVRSKQEFTRAQSLFLEEAISQEKLEAITANFIKIKSALKQAFLDHKANLQREDILLDEITEAKERIKQSKARLAASENDLGGTIIKAPAKGIISNKNISLGSYVRAGTPLFSIVVIDSIYIEANFKETQIINLKKGQRVEITIDAIKGHKFHGQVSSLAPASGAVFSLLPAENATGNFTKVIQRVPVRIELDKNDPLFNKLIPGLSTVVKVKIN